MTVTGRDARDAVSGGMPPTAVDPAPIVARLRAAGCVFAEDEAAVLIAAASEAGARSAARRDVDVAAAGPSATARSATAGQAAAGSAAAGAAAAAPSAAAAALEEMVAQRASGRPLEHVVGWAAFGGLRIPVIDGVFVPRRRSELLARLAADAARRVAARRPGAPVVVVDLCCGAGALGAVVADRVSGVQLHSVDIDPAAVGCARRAAAPYGGTVYHGDLFGPLPSVLRGRVDVLIANAPYVPTGEIAFLPADARQFENPLALDGGGDGLAVLRRVVDGAPDWLAPTGRLLTECARHQAASLVDAVTGAGLVARVEHDDRIGATAVVGTATDHTATDAAAVVDTATDGRAGQ